MATIGRVRAVLGLNKNKILTLLAQAQDVYTGLGANTTVFTPNPALPTLLGLIQDLQKAQQAVSTTKGGAAARNVKRDLLVTALESERMMVQAVCDANPEQAKAYIVAAAMKVAVNGAHPKPFLAATVALPSGTVVVEANAGLLDNTGRSKVYNWEYTLDGKTYLAAPSTPGPRTIIANLPPLTTVGFRVSVTISKLPQGAWSQVVSILVR